MSRLRLAKLDALETSEMGSGVAEPNSLPTTLPLLPEEEEEEEEELDDEPKLLLKEAEPVELSEALSTEVARLRREVDRRRDGSTLLLLWQCFSMVDHLFNIVSIISRDKTTRPFASGCLDELMEQLISPSACAANGRLGGSARPRPPGRRRRHFLSPH